MSTTKTNLSPFGVSGDMYIDCPDNDCVRVCAGEEFEKRNMLSKITKSFIGVRGASGREARKRAKWGTGKGEEGRDGP